MDSSTMVKPGDNVIRIGSVPTGWVIKQGDTYRIADIAFNSIRLEGDESWYLKTEFDLIQPNVADESNMSAGDMLRKAAEIVDGSRNTTHGNKERSFEAIATLWNTYLGMTSDVSHYITGKDVAWMMVLLKIARSHNGQPVDDHFIDAAGYAAIAGELSHD